MPGDTGMNAIKSFDISVDETVSELNRLWADRGFTMADIPVGTQRRADTLNIRMTQLANEGRFNEARALLSEWKTCWIPKESEAEAQYRFEERAAIMEYDGGLNRDEAERLARERK